MIVTDGDHVVFQARLQGDDQAEVARRGWTGRALHYPPSSFQSVRSAGLPPATAHSRNSGHIRVEYAISPSFTAPSSYSMLFIVDAHDIYFIQIPIGVLDIVNCFTKFLMPVVLHIV